MKRVKLAKVFLVLLVAALLLAVLPLGHTATAAIKNFKTIIYYDLDGGSYAGSTARQSLTVEQREDNGDITFTHYRWIPEKKGYRFFGWYLWKGSTPGEDISELRKTDSSGISLYDRPGQRVTLKTGNTTSNISYTYRALWFPDGTITYTLTFDANGGSVPISSKSARNTSSTYNWLPTPTREEYNFEFWSTRPDDSSGKFAVSPTHSVISFEDHTLYAIWSPVRYTLSYDRNGGVAGGTGIPAATSVGWGLEIQLPENISRDGYTLLGWSADPAAVEAQCSPGGTFIMPKADTTLYAVWEEVVLPENPYRDVFPDDRYYDAVLFAYGRGLMTGVDEGVFAPDETLTREQAIAIIARLSGDGYLKCAGQAPFEDVAADRWSAAAIAWARETGVTHGVGENLFAPESAVTLDQFEAMLMRHFKLQEQWSGETAAGSRADAAWLLHRYVTQYGE